VGRHYRQYGVPAHAISVPADSASEIVKFTISIPRESCTNAKAKFSASEVTTLWRYTNLFIIIISSSSLISAI